MLNLTAIIRCKPDRVDTVLAALVAVGDYARAHEPGTLDYRVIQVTEDPTLLITQESFRDQDAMTAHNEGEGSKMFFAVAEGCLDKVEIHIGVEAFSLGQTAR